MRRMDFEQWGKMPIGARRDFKRGWDKALLKILRSPSMEVELSLELVSDAVAMGDAAAIRSIQAKPKEPMSWAPDFPPRELGSESAMLRGSGLSLLERSSQHPIHAALLAAARGEFGCLDAILEAAGPVVKIKALEHAVRIGDPLVFDAVMDSIAVAPEPEGGWPLRRELYPDGRLKSSGFCKDDLDGAVVYPFGSAFEDSLCSGFIHAIQRLGGALGPQITFEGAKPDRLLTYRSLSRCVELNTDPIPALVSGLAYMEPRAAKDSLGYLKRAGERELASMRMDKHRRDQIVEAVEAKMLSFEMDATLAGADASASRPKVRI